MGFIDPETRAGGEVLVNMNEIVVWCHRGDESIAVTVGVLDR